MVRVYFKTFGCSTNFSESEVMKGLLKEAGFEIARNEEKAYVVVLNICTVKTDNLALREIKRVVDSYPNKKLVVAGCIPGFLIKKIKEIAPDCGLINTHNIKEIVAVVEETINEHPVEAFSQSAEIKINLPRIRRIAVIGIVPISNSCIGSCAYCSVKGIKGKFKSYPVESILKEIKFCLKDGCKEIWLTAQDTGCYGQDIGINLIELLDKINEIDGEFLIRLGMANPNHIKKITDELIRIYRNKKMFKFLHLPVQSGSNEILKLMNRRYIVDEFKEIVERFRKEIPEITIATDIICGFPTETNEQFMESKKLVEEIKPDVIHISRFRPRPGTPAVKMKQVPGEEIKQRSSYLTSIFEWAAVEQNKKWAGWEGVVLIDEKGKNNTWIGRNYCYKPVILQGNLRLGDIVKVRVNETTKYDLRGGIIGAKAF